MSTNIEKKILAAQYETMVRNALDKQSQNTVLHKRVATFIGSFLLSCFFTWCSSGDTSFFPTLFSENIVVRYSVCNLPVIIFIVFEVSLCISAKRIKKEVDFEYEMCMCSWLQRFREFILKRVGYERDDDFIKNMDSIKEKMKKHEDIVFDEYDFSEYLKEYYKKYKFDVYFDFYTHLAKVILLESEVNGTLIFDKGRYVYIVKDNIELLFMAARQM